MLSRDEKANYERAALQSLQQVAQASKASHAARVAAARAILEHLNPQPAKQTRAKVATKGPQPTQAQLEDQLAEVRRKRLEGLK